MAWLKMFFYDKLKRLELGRMEMLYILKVDAQEIFCLRMEEGEQRG